MKIIISPAKKMITDSDSMSFRQMPVYLDKAEMLKNYLKSLSYEELKKLLDCNDKIATVNYERFQRMDLNNNLSPAIFSYDGIQYKYMAPQVFESSYYEYIEKHLRILSGFYGVLKPFDSITPYRLEMMSKVKTEFCENLYEFWGKDIFNELTKDDKVILNLASDEYSKAVYKYTNNEDIRFINCVFGEMKDNKVIEKGVYVKMARGEMVRYMAENNVVDLSELKSFNRLGYKYNSDLSSENTFVFIKEKSLKG